MPASYPISTRNFSVTCFSTGGNLGLQFPEDLPADLLELLHQFAVVFENPKGLPPNRSHDHSIHLKAGVQQVKVRPHRYPFSCD